MKKLNVLIIASLTGLALAGGALFGDTVSAKSQPKPQKEVEQAAPQKQGRQLKDWEKKYYELHPDELKKDEEKNDPEKRHHTDDDGIEWHRI